MADPNAETPADRRAADGRDALARALCETVRFLGARELAPATSGNFSAVLGRDPLRVLITSSGVDKRSLRPDQLLVVDDSATPVRGESLRPSAESLLHTRLARRDPEIGCILHTHSVWNTLVGEHYVERGVLRLRGFELQKGIRGVSSHEHIVALPIVPNDQDMERLADRMERALDAQHPDPQAGGRGRITASDAASPDAAPVAAVPGFVIAGHGLYTWGRDVDEARRHVETLEFLLECVGRRTDLRPY